MHFYYVNRLEVTELSHLAILPIMITPIQNSLKLQGYIFLLHIGMISTSEMVVP